MTVGEQVYTQARLLAGDLETRHENLLKVLCECVTATLTAQLRQGMTPSDCAADFIAAASLLALAALNGAADTDQVEQWKAGAVTVKSTIPARDAASRCLQRQAALMIAPYLQDRFVFRGV